MRGAGGAPGLPGPAGGLTTTTVAASAVCSLLPAVQGDRRRPDAGDGVELPSPPRCGCCRWRAEWSEFFWGGNAECRMQNGVSGLWLPEQGRALAVDTYSPGPPKPYGPHARSLQNEIKRGSRLVVL